ncbi:electron transport complex subunit RsxC [Thioalkalivibrio thiocyanodenitrificans]|uniref:electron transport complex subunit RsxC n=1 Tax=Thioalkalivibrio thiocyanodenitrificans TaxID=243063 RepID=UPI00036F4A0D|nr:electron transport complex subunit RsxC [Thioalkalivibrio thiocyanodenitrificans]
MSELIPKLRHFHGGLKLPPDKEASTRDPVLTMPVPARLVVPLRQHIGEAAEACVKAGDAVEKGQVIGRCDTYVGAAVHAPTSGYVAEVADHPVPHPSGLSAPCVVIETDGRDHWGDSRLPPVEDYLNADPSDLRNCIREAGIVGLGGAAFPAAVKITPRPGQALDCLVINGSECEPFITCDDMLMRTRAREVIEGVRILMQAVQPRRCLIGIEDHMTAAIGAMRQALGGEEADGIRIVPIPSQYPAGGERQLIQVLTGREVPSQGLPADIGMVCQNVGTAAAIYRAVALGEPLISRIVTVAGRGVNHPRNLEVLIGTPFSDLIAAAGGYSAQVARLIMGGPMMGFAMPSDEVPVVKATNCILAATDEDVAPPGPVMPCIRCGECTRVCPAQLLPQQLYWYARAKDFDKTQDYNLFDCIECGCCAYVCPSNIPLVQYYRYAKTEIWAQERERRKADIARERHEFRQQRLEQEEREKAERMARKKAALAARNGEDGDDPKKAAIQAALERAKARKAAEEPEQMSTGKTQEDKEPSG